ncbi:DUF6179 domain-containing protein [uncultured Anaerofustis sp.]|uniref:DUF6179 domain-containing protein n=1 Tax=uncultured Anaerofustis sp. TaxID=904996 RepID=UPI0025DCA2F1|nr:DUF6179 domain-containing protein [uncultured Anaerofustis sp.]
MKYNYEKILPILIDLMGKYTSKDSSSVSYETAEMLLQGILYCIEENFKDNNILDRNASIEFLYENGLDIVNNKVLEAKGIYEDIINDFEDYGVRNYKDTILKGIPMFFIKYIPKHFPQNNILTLDYPIIKGNPNSKCGIDLILEYLNSVKIEKEFLSLFNKDIIIDFLEYKLNDYRNLYLDNICFPVLFNTICRFISGNEINSLILSDKDIMILNNFFVGYSKDKIKNKIETIMNTILNKKMSDYFMYLSDDYAFFFYNKRYRF